MQFDLGALPADAKIVSAQLSLMGMSRVYFDPGTGGIWRLSLLDSSVDMNWTQLNYYQIHNAGVKATSLAYDMAVTSTSRASSTTIQLHLTLHPGAALGPRRVALTNLDGGSVTCACVTVTFPYQTATAATKPNIVVINTDDQRWDSLGQMSATNGRTDWARFPNAFVHEPETIAGPESPPLSSRSRESRRKPALGALTFAEWHSQQVFTKTGLTLVS